MSYRCLSKQGSRRRYSVSLSVDEKVVEKMSALWVLCGAGQYGTPPVLDTTSCAEVEEVGHWIGFRGLEQHLDDFSVAEVEAEAEALAFVAIFSTEPKGGMTETVFRADYGQEAVVDRQPLS
ncbi:hypothetical protein NDU88_000464 [Pleurodeles waltl]|uniref:Uncharacterized protein n=1 Tax=Pleurodeles waltl TaxID=8319 RepID=A0AAV7Q1B6_PLEWA|nr:hypothetical protein NDU88_000464 [Pleurodeles waltl]